MKSEIVLTIIIIVLLAVVLIFSSALNSKSIEVKELTSYKNAYKSMLVKYEGYSKGSIVGDSFILIPPKPGTHRERKRFALNKAIREMDIEDEVEKATAEIRAKYDR